MLRMSFLEHLEEMRSRIIRALMGFGVAFLLCMIFCYPLWDFVRAPAVDALTKIGVNPPNLVINEPMEGFSIIWVKVPLVFALFLASPWVLLSGMGFHRARAVSERKAPGASVCSEHGGTVHPGRGFRVFRGVPLWAGVSVEYRAFERRDAAGHHHALFRFVRQRDAGRGAGIRTAGSHFLSDVLHLASPRFLMQHSRYAILAIVIVAAIITPTPDFFNLMLFAVPMCRCISWACSLAYLLVLKREGKKFPWG